MMVVVMMRPTSLRREAQQVCLIFQTTAATSNRDRKQLERGQRRGIRSSIHQKSMIPAYSKQNTQKNAQRNDAPVHDSVPLFLL